MMDYLRRQRLEAAAKIEVAENKLTCIQPDPEDPESVELYDRWTAELLISTREHRSIIVMAKRAEREAAIAVRIRAGATIRNQEKEQSEQEPEETSADHPRAHGVLQPA